MDEVGIAKDLPSNYTYEFERIVSKIIKTVNNFM